MERCATCPPEALPPAALCVLDVDRTVSGMRTPLEVAVVVLAGSAALVTGG